MHARSEEGVGGVQKGGGRQKVGQGGDGRPTRFTRMIGLGGKQKMGEDEVESAKQRDLRHRSTEWRSEKKTRQFYSVGGNALGFVGGGL